MMEEVPLNEPEKEEISEEQWKRLLKKGKFKKEDMDMLVMDFLVNKELPVVAETFHRESGCELGIEDLSLLETQKIVRDLIFNRQFDEAIKLINEKLGLSFLTNRRRLHFHLEQQKMIELCRRHNFEAALDFSHKFVEWENAWVEDDDFKEECRRTLLLMTYGNDPESPAAGLLNFTRGFVLATSVVEAIIISQGRQPGNFIEKAMKMLRSEQTQLNQVVKFPHFNLVSGYPEPLPHADTGLREPF